MVFFLYKGDDDDDNDKSRRIIKVPKDVTQVKVINNCVSIQSKTFSYCTTLVTVELCDGIRYLGEWTFRNCFNLQTITIPSTVIDIPRGIFQHCYSLSKVVFLLRSSSSSSESGSISGSGEEKGKEGGGGSSSSSLKAIGNHSFSGCTALRSIIIPSTVEVIDAAAFHYCINLSEIRIQQQQQQQQHFHNNNNKKKNTKSSSSCSCSLKIIGEQAFWKCTSLKEITIPSSSLIEIGEFAFVACQSLVTVNFLVEEEEEQEEEEDKSNSNLTRVAVVVGEGGGERERRRRGGGLKSIGGGAFRDCIALTSICNIPRTVQELGTGIFWNCQSLHSVTLPIWLLHIPDLAFYDCHSLDYISIPSTVISIGQKAFYNCYGLMNVEFQQQKQKQQKLGGRSSHHHRYYCCCNLQVIGEGAFGNCLSLKKIIIPSSVIEIKFGAFWCCTRLLSVEFESSSSSSSMSFSSSSSSSSSLSSLKSIGKICFRNCKALKNIYIPSSVTGIGDNPFLNCKSLERMTQQKRTMTTMTILQQNNYHDGDDDDDNDRNLIYALRTRFDNLPLHELCYYNNNNNNNNKTNSDDENNNSELESSIWVKQFDQLLSMDTSTTGGDKRDVLGMTPLHILTISSTVDVSVIEKLMNVHPNNLITKDNTGQLPIHYACKGDSTPDVIKVLLDGHCTNFPNYPMNWDELIRIAFRNCTTLESTMSIVQSRINRRVEFLGLPEWREGVLSSLHQSNLLLYQNCNSYESFQVQLKQHLYDKLALYERKEVISLLEHAVWKKELLFVDDDNDDDDIIHYRQNCRINCGADIIILNVLQFLSTAI